MIDRPADEGPFDPAFQDVVDQFRRGARADRQVDPGMGGREAGQDRRQMQGRRGLQGPDDQIALRHAVVGDRAPGIGDQPRRRLGEGQQAFPGRRQAHAPGMAFEQGSTQAVLQQAHPRRHVGLHGMQFRRRAVHGAGAGDRLEDAEIGKLHGRILIN